MTARLLPASLLLAACGAIPERHSFVGPLTPEIPSRLCEPTTATLDVRDDQVVFSPNEGTWVLTGKATPGTLSLTRDRPTPDRKLFHTELRAEWSESAVRGRYATPFCTYRVSLAPR